MTMRFILISLFTLSAFVAIGQKNVVSKSAQKISEFKQNDSKLNKHFSSAYGYAMFPSIGKGGIGIGGASGNGTLYKGGAPVGDCKLTQISVGFQFGGQKYAELIFFKDASAYQRFVDGNFEFGAQVSAVALKSGASADATYRDGVLVFTQAEAGLMYEAAVGGQKFKVKMH